MLLMMLAGWINRQQLEMIDYLKDEDVSSNYDNHFVYMNLLIDSMIVRSYTSPDDEYIRIAGFDVSEFIVKKAKPVNLKVNELKSVWNK